MKYIGKITRYQKVRRGLSYEVYPNRETKTGDEACKADI